MGTGAPPLDSGLGPSDSGADAASAESDASDSGSDAGPSDAGLACTFPRGIDEPAQPILWDTAIDVPWSTGFEDGFCGFATETGYCLAGVDAPYAVTDAPVRSGTSAAAFPVATQDSLDGVQSRCVRRGVLPESAYYGAWYFVPSLAQTLGNWNLFHFQGGDGEARRGLWDVSLHNGDDGQLYPHIFDQSTGAIYNPPPGAPPIPIAEWVHIQLFLRRAADASGEVALYQNGELVVRITDIVTDDTVRGAWYVGNWAEDLIPPELTVFVDDVSIGDTL